MPLKLKKTGPAVPTSVIPDKGAHVVTAAPKGLKESSIVKVFDIPVDLLVEHSDNPNVQNEKVFDEMVNKIRKDGFDEPIIVVPYVQNGKPTGKWLITSGHHRKKAATTLGMKMVPAIIREGWNEDQVLIELINRNTLSGTIDPFKFTEAVDKLKKRYDLEQIKRMTGLNEKKAFDALYKRIIDKAPPKIKKKLEDAKEDIKSIDDLTGILHAIFKEHGSELDWGMMVFSHGGKKHFYVKIDSSGEKAMEALQKKMESANLRSEQVFSELLSDTKYLDNVIKKVQNANPTAVKAST